jgi:BMFP domain-containing protein YqiC
VKQLVDAIPSGVRSLPLELEKQFHQILHTTFVKMDLVTREEFDAQVRVLQRTREKLEALEKKLTPHKSSTEK